MNTELRRRGRPPNIETQEKPTMETNPDHKPLPTREQMDADRARRVDEIRKNRTPLTGSHLRLTAVTDPNYHYRWVNDDPGRIALFEKAGYTVVQANNAHSHDGIGSSVASVAAGLNPEGRERRMVLMHIPREIHEDDILEKRRIVDETEEPIRDARIGKATRPMKANEEQSGDDGGFYTPATGTSLRRQ